MTHASSVPQRPPSPPSCPAAKAPPLPSAAVAAAACAATRVNVLMCDATGPRTGSWTARRRATCALVRLGTRIGMWLPHAKPPMLQEAIIGSNLGNKAQRRAVAPAFHGRQRVQDDSQRRERLEGQTGGSCTGGGAVPLYARSNRGLSITAHIIPLLLFAADSARHIGSRRGEGCMQVAAVVLPEASQRRALEEDVGAHAAAAAAARGGSGRQRHTCGEDAADGLNAAGALLRLPPQHARGDGRDEVAESRREVDIQRPALSLGGQSTTHGAATEGCEL